MAMQLVEDDSVNEKRMRDFAQTLSEKDFRRFAAIEAAQRGYGAIVYIADVLGCSTKTIERGLKELVSVHAAFGVSACWSGGSRQGIGSPLMAAVQTAVR